MGRNDVDENEQDEAREEMRKLEEADEVPSDPKDWPDGKAKFLTFDNEGKDPYGEGITSKLGPPSVAHQEDGSVTVDGEKVDNPEDYKGEPIEGGPTDPHSAAIPGEVETSQED
jgi:hypothetical protein